MHTSTALRAKPTREAEEEGDVIASADVAAGVQAEDAARGHQVVHHGEDALLHLPRILAAQDDHLARLSQEMCNVRGGCNSRKVTTSAGKGIEAYFMLLMLHSYVDRSKVSKHAVLPA